MSNKPLFHAAAGGISFALERHNAYVH